MSKINTILVAGGTHGNERTGVAIIEKWAKKPEFFKALCPSAQVEILMANPSAVRLCRRYDGQDLNRSFSNTTLAIQGKSLCYEVNRARELNAAFGPKGKNTKTDLLIDIHNTTANMGYCLILSERNPFTMKASAVLTTEFPSAKIYYQPEERGESPYFGTIAKADICLEVGPQCHGTIAAELFETTEKIVVRYLELAEEWNAGKLQQREGIPVDIYTQFKDIDYPRDRSGRMTAMIHPNLLGHDYEELREGMPIYRTFDGEDVLYHDETVCPIFVDEAAYYEKKWSMSLTKKSREVW